MSTQDIQIVEITKTPLHRDPRFALPSFEIGFDIHVQNVAAVACYVISSLRRVVLEGDVLAMNLDLLDKQTTQRDRRTPRHRIGLHAILVAPQTQAAVHVAVRTPIEDVRHRKDGLPSFESIDISNVEHVRCTIAYMRAPADAQAHEEVMEMFGDEAKWEIASATFRGVKRVNA
jgi:hypothetical protein